LKSFSRDLSENVEVLAKAVLPSGVSGQDAQREAFLSGIAELAESFLLLHELFHICCGHVGWMASRQTRDQVFSYGEIEAGFDSSIPRPSHSRSNIWAGYFREMEADNSALQWLVRAPLPVSMRGLSCFPPDDRESSPIPIFELSGRARRLAFAAVLNAVWLMLLALQNNRTQRTDALTRGVGVWRRTTHPVPAARVIAAVFTLLAQYAELTSGRFDSAGYQMQVLTGAQAAAARDFVRRPLRKTLRAAWRGGFAYSEREESSFNPTVIILEVLHLLKGEVPASVAGEQLHQLQALRFAQAAKYARFRQLPVGSEPVAKTTTVNIAVPPGIAPKRYIATIERALEGAATLKIIDEREAFGFDATEIVITVLAKLAANITAAMLAGRIKKAIDWVRKGEKQPAKNHTKIKAYTKKKAGKRKGAGRAGKPLRVR